MRVRHFWIAAVALAGFAAPMHAQAKKPGGLNKAARDVSTTMKKAGRDTKAEVHRDASKTHQALTKAGNDTKAELKRATGVTSKSPSATHKPGGANKLARDVSHAGKNTGAQAKHGLKKTGSSAHKTLTKTGKSAKESVKQP